MNDLRRAPRLAVHPTQLTDRSSAVVFEFEGRPVEAHEGDTVASALFAAGVSTFSRSFKYHRPRGLLCVEGRCPNCLMTVDGVPNVRACTQRVRPGMRVRHQNAWPSLDRDFLSVLDRLGRFMPVGFYYKVFHRPKLLWRLAQPIIRRVAGLGALDMGLESDVRYHHQHRHTDVAVVGGGPAGMSAALAAASAGAARVTLIDDQPSLGGHLRLDTCTHRDISGIQPAPGFEIANEFARSVLSSASIQVLSGATAIGLYQYNLLGIARDNHVVKLRAKRIVIATGSYEEPLIFERNDLPGVMLSTGARRLARLYGVKPGETAVLAISNDHGYGAALDLLEAGVRVAAIVDVRPRFPHGLEAAETLKSRGVLTLTSHAVVRAEGKRRVAETVVVRLENGAPTGEERRFSCDLLCMSGGFQPASSLLYQAGCGLSYDETVGEVVPRRLPSGVYAAGEVTGIHELHANILQGRLAGKEAAADLGPIESKAEAELAELRLDLTRREEQYRGQVTASPTTGVAARGDRRFVCFCEDITAGDISDAIEEGFEDIQTLKRYSTVTMGPCQGKMCLKSFVAITAQRTGRGIDETGVTTSRPPVQPVLLGALAGPAHMPVKRTAIHRKHRQMGATMVDLGPWRRPYSYGSPQEECIDVRQRVGIIDVSTLGKLDVRGRDAPEFLDKVYTHRFSGLRIGRIRYGLLCSDNGAIMDDGTVTRLGEDRYFITTTTGNVELMEEWFKWWMAGTEMCVHVTNITSAFAAINVAGPKARDTLNKLADIDLSPDAFRYMSSGQGMVAGVPAILLRIGFVGESGWELHFPAEYGEHMWEALMEAGEEFGIAPFGLEAQRILRLEKKHIIVGQDTDAVSNPLEGDMSWVVRFDKEDFIGRGGLVGIRERGLRDRLVGFLMRGGSVPEDGDPVMRGRDPVGRVTSSRMSPTLGKGLGLAWVPVDLAEEGREIRILVDGNSLPADVTLRPFYDAEGERLRE